MLTTSHSKLDSNIRILVTNSKPILQDLAAAYKLASLEKDDYTIYRRILSSLQSIEEIEQEIGFLEPEMKKGDRLKQLPIKF